MSGLIQKLPGVTFTDGTLPKLARDSVINDGSLFCFDLADGYCSPQPAGSVASGSTLVNLVAGRANATTVGAMTKTSAGAFLLPGTDGFAIDFGATHSRADNHAFLTCFWGKVDASLNAAYPSLMGLANNTSTLEYVIDGGASPGRDLRALGPGGAGVYGAIGSPLTTRFQVAIMWEPGTIRAYFNGALVGTATGAPTSVTYPSGMSEGVGRNTSAPAICTGFAPWKGSVYRAWKEDLAVSAAAAGLSVAAQALAQIQKDWAANSTRFS